MAEVLDWQRAARPRAVPRFIASALRQGALVALPSEWTYLLAASVHAPDAVTRLRELAGKSPCELVVTGAAAARDWLPDLGPAGRRLVRRFWPGPVTLLSNEGTAEGMLGRLQAGVREALSTSGSLHLRQPDHQLLAEILRRMPAPLVATSVRAGEGEAYSAQQVEQAAGERIDLIVDGGLARYRMPATVVEVVGDSWSVRRPGLVPEEEVRQQLACVIVFVCTGNTCRSPLAEALCKKHLAARLGCTVEELPARGYLVVSAGMAAAPGTPAADEAAEVARSLGADLSGHQSRPLTAELVEMADHLLVMRRTCQHAEAHLGERASRARLLDPEGEDVADPIGQPLEVYAECARQMDRHVQKILDRLLVE